MVLDQVDLIAREHEMLAEKLSERVADKLKQLHKDCTNTRKAVCSFIDFSILYSFPKSSSNLQLMSSASQLQQEYKDWQSSLERVRFLNIMLIATVSQPFYKFLFWASFIFCFIMCYNLSKPLILLVLFALSRRSCEQYNFFPVTLGAVDCRVALGEIHTNT